MKKQKKLLKPALSLFLASVLLCGLTACGNKNGNSSAVSSGSLAAESEQTALISSEENATSSEKNNSSKAKKNNSSKQKNNSSKVKKNSSVKKNNTEDDGLNLSALDKAVLGYDDTMYPSSLVETGNSARIANLMKKAQNGGSYTIGVVGGSITQGAVSSSGKSYGDLVCEWWKKNFPKAKFTFVNAGIGATDQYMACFRLETDLLRYNPDFVVIDFTVNNNGSDMAYQTVVNRVYNHKTQPGVMAIHFTHCNNKYFAAGIYENNMKIPDYFTKTLKNYKIPTVSFHDYVWKHINARDFTFTDVMADYIHPNNNGHAIAAGLITKHLEYVKANTAKLAGTAPTSPKLSDNELVNVGYLTNTTAGVSVSGGFKKLGNTSPVTRGWKFESGTAGTLTFTVPSNTKTASLFMCFESGATGSFTVNAGTADEQTFSHNVATVPQLVQVKTGISTYTVTANADCGNFTIYGIALTLK